MSRLKGMLLRYPKINVYGICAFALIALAIGIRIRLIHLGWPLLDSDEGTMGLMGMHIAFKGETPIFFYGQSYMGAAEAYIAGFLFRLFGVSTFNLRLGMIFLFSLFLLFMYLLTSLLFSKKWAIITLLLLVLGSDALLTRELVAVGGDAETLVSGSLILLLSVWLSLTVQDPTKRKKRLLAYALWGLAAGFGIWSHLLVVPFILLGLLILLLFCRKEIFNREILKCFSWPGLLLFVSVIIGALPLISYNVQPQNFFSKNNIFITFWNIHRVSSLSQKPLPTLLPYQLLGAFRISLPTATGASPLCQVTTQANGIALLNAHIVNFGSPYATQCTLIHTFWPLGIVILWFVAAIMALYSLKPYWRRLGASEWSEEERPIVVQNIASLALLATAAITFGLFIASPNAALFPVATSRYLIGLLITTPALLWPLWSGANAVKPLALRIAHVTVAVHLARISVFLRQGLLLLIVITLLLGTINTFAGIFPTSPITASQDIFATQAIDQHLNVPETIAYNQQENALFSQLSHLGIIYIYSDYWTCDRVIFRTNERLTCATIHAANQKTFCTGVLASNSPAPADLRGKALNGQQKGNILGQNRYPYYTRKVARHTEASFVVQENSTLATLMDHCIATSPIIYNKYTNAGGYAIYQPTTKHRIVHT